MTHEKHPTHTSTKAAHYPHMALSGIQDLFWVFCYLFFQAPWTCIFELHTQTLKMAISLNDKESFKNALIEIASRITSHGFNNCFLYHCRVILIISSNLKFVNNFLNNVANRQTNQRPSKI